jgi:galactokinase
MDTTLIANSGLRTDLLVERYERLFGGHPFIFRAPGRINLIGEHTDYNDGFVMPAAIQFATLVAAGERNDNTLHIYAQSFGEQVQFSLDSLAGPPRGHWSDYVRGVAATLLSAGYKLRGANLLIQSDVPIGGGLSSSAALEVSTALALAAVSGIELPSLQIPKLCQSAEQNFTGTRCGIMDQFISTFGRAGHAMMLDCRTLEYSWFPLPADVRVAVCNSGVKRELAAGEYNRRREACETGVTLLKTYLPEIRALRDVSPEELNRYQNKLPEVVYRRCRHVTTEDRRVEAAASALLAGDVKSFGELMYQSHASLRDDYEVSCAELDILVEAARTVKGVLGARMMGGGFGGCTVNLVTADAVDDFQKTVAECYRQKTGKTPAIHICTIAEGAGAVI